MWGMNAKLKLGFSWHALPLTCVRKFAPEKDLKSIRSRNDGWRISVGISPDRQTVLIRRPSDLFTNLSRFPTEIFLTREL
jgi:hypothetical protein